jgi:hypothetical protein
MISKISRNTLTKVNKNITRLFSSEITIDDIKKNEIHVKNHIKHVNGTSNAKSLTDVLGTGVELHKPKNEVELSLFSGIDLSI